MELHVYEIDDGERHFYAAESQDAALRMYLEAFIPNLPESLHDIPTDKLHYLPVRLDEIEIYRKDDEVPFIVRNEKGEDEVKTFGEWAALGAGCVASSCY